jgi:hypothetical protein
MPGVLEGVHVARRSYAQPAWRTVPEIGRTSTLLTCTVGALAGLGLIAWLAFVLEMRQRAAEERWANETVAEHVLRAQGHVSRQEWDQAVVALQSGLATGKATDLGKAQELLSQCRNAQVDALLETALGALRKEDLHQAASVLNNYLVSPLATRKERAALLLAEMDLAASDEHAVEILKHLPQSALAAVARREEMPGLDRISNEALRAIYAETLLRNLPNERKRRAALEEERVAQRAAEQRAREEKTLREEAVRRVEERRIQNDRARHLARLRATPVFRELTEAVTGIRKQLEEQHRFVQQDDDQLLATLLQGNGDKDPSEQLRIMKMLDERQQHQNRDECFKLWQESVAEKVSVKRAHIKERFRTYQEFGKADWPIFDALVDRELDQLVEELNKSLVDDFAAGLRLLTGN